MNFRLRPFAFAGLALALAACGDDGRSVACDDLPATPAISRTPPPAFCSNFSSTLTVRDRMGNAVTTIPRREAVTLEYKVTNNGTGAQTLNAVNGCGPTLFTVTAADEAPACTVFYNPAKDAACPAVVTPTPYAAGETRTFTATWQQTDLDGAQVPSGRYVANVTDQTECYTLGKSVDLRVQ